MKRSAGTIYERGEGKGRGGGGEGEGRGRGRKKGGGGGGYEMSKVNDNCKIFPLCGFDINLDNKHAREGRIKICF